MPGPDGYGPDVDAALDERVRRLSDRQIVERSPDGRVHVRVRGDGALIGIRFDDDVLRRYDNAALAELVTRTVRGAQRRARTEYQRAVGELFAATE